MSDQQTDKAVSDWQSALQRLENAKREVNSAECDEVNKRNALGKWLCPDDAKVGESFSIWISGKLLTVTKSGEHDYSAYWRKGSKKSQSANA